MAQQTSNDSDMPPVAHRGADLPLLLGMATYAFGILAVLSIPAGLFTGPHILIPGIIAFFIAIAVGLGQQAVIRQKPHALPLIVGCGAILLTLAVACIYQSLTAEEPLGWIVAAPLAVLGGYFVIRPMYVLPRRGCGL